MTDKTTVDRELLRQIVECSASEPEQMYGLKKQLRALLDAPAVEPSCRTDQQIVDQTEELAKFLLFWKYAYEPENETLMREAIHPKAEDSWQAACRVQEMLTDTDPMDAVAEVDDEPAPAQEPDAFLHDDGCWTAAKTTAGQTLNNRLRFAGSSKVAVYTAPPAPIQKPVSNVVLREEIPTLLAERDIKPTDTRLFTSPHPREMGTIDHIVQIPDGIDKDESVDGRWETEELGPEFASVLYDNLWELHDGKPVPLQAATSKQFAAGIICAANLLEAWINNPVFSENFNAWTDRDAFRIIADWPKYLKELADTATMQPEQESAVEPVVGALQIQLFGGEWIDCSQDTFNHYRKTGRSARALYTAPQPRKAVKLTSEEISQMWIDESFDAASHESCYMRGVRRGEAAFIAKNGLES